MEAWDPVWMTPITIPRVKWVWDVLGNNAFVINVMVETSWRKRFFTKIFFGSKWSRPLKNNK